MELILIVGGYVVGWAVASKITLKHWMNSLMRGHCTNSHAKSYHSERDYCIQDHGGSCWQQRGKPDMIDAGVSSLIAIFWPLLIMPYLVMRSYKEPHNSVDLKKIADLERELGMDK
jgi:hypothetical protein